MKVNDFKVLDNQSMNNIYGSGLDPDAPVNGVDPTVITTIFEQVEFD